MLVKTPSLKDKLNEKYGTPKKEVEKSVEVVTKPKRASKAKKSQ